MITSDYIVGLTDGEGCFYVNVRPPDKRYSRSKHSVATHFYLKMKEEELDLLRKIKKFFGCGAIYFQKDNRRNHTSCYRYEINSQKDIHQILIPFFDKHLPQSSKKKDYMLFREIAMLIKLKKHRQKEGLQKIVSLKSKMNLGARPVREIRTPGSGV